MLKKWGATMAEYKDIELLKKQIADFKRVVNSPNSDYLTGYISALSATEGIIAGLPDADVEPVKHGEWKEITIHNGCTYDYDCVCSECRRGGHPFDNYCHNCGAKMDGKEVQE